MNYQHGFVRWGLVGAVLAGALLLGGGMLVVGARPAPGLSVAASPRLLVCIRPIRDPGQDPPCPTTPPPTLPTGPTSLGTCPASDPATRGEVTQLESCLSLLLTLQTWGGWLVGAIGVLGLLWILLTCYQVTGIAGGGLREGAFHQIGSRSIQALFAFFAAQQATNLSIEIAFLLGAHRWKQELSPLGVGVDLTLFTLNALFEALLGWFLLRGLVAVGEGVLAAAGYSRRPLGVTLRALGRLVVLAVLVIALPVLINRLAGVIVL